MLKAAERQLLESVIREYFGEVDIDLEGDGSLIFDVQNDLSVTGYDNDSGDGSFLVTVRADDDSGEQDDPGAPAGFRCVVFGWYLMDITVQDPDSAEGVVLLDRLAAIANAYSHAAGINLLLTMPSEAEIAAGTGAPGQHALVVEMAVVEPALRPPVIEAVLERLNNFVVRFVGEIADSVREAQAARLG